MKTQNHSATHAPSLHRRQTIPRIPRVPRSTPSLAQLPGNSHPCNPRNPWLILSAFFAFLAVKSSGATVTGNLLDISLAPLTTTLTFAPTNSVLVSSTGLSAGPPRSIVATNGAFTLQLDAGNYTVCLPLVPTRQCFTIAVPPGSSTNTYNITNLITGGAYVYLPYGSNGGSNGIAVTNGFGYGTTTFEKVVATNFVGNGSQLTNLIATNITGSRFVLTLNGNATNLAARSTANTTAAITAYGIGGTDDFTKPGILNLKGTSDSNLLQFTEYIDGSHQFSEANFIGGKGAGVGQNLGTWNFIERSSNLRAGFVEFATDGGMGSSNFRMNFNADSGETLVVTYNGQMDVQGDLNVTGTKNFLIPHPLRASALNLNLSPNLNLRHSAVEAPRADLIYRGTFTLTNGAGADSIDRASGMTPGTFAALTQHAQALRPQNETGWDEVRAQVVGGDVVVECCNTNSNDRVSWVVIAERADAAYLSSPSVRNGAFITEPQIPTRSLTNSLP